MYPIVSIVTITPSHLLPSSSLWNLVHSLWFICKFVFIPYKTVKITGRIFHELDRVRESQGCTKGRVVHFLVHVVRLDTTRSDSKASYSTPVCLYSPDSSSVCLYMGALVLVVFSLVSGFTFTSSPRDSFFLFKPGGYKISKGFLKMQILGV